MRELTLIETGYLCGLLVLSLVLPLLLSFRAPRDAAVRKSCLKTVWLGQMVGAFAGFVILVSAALAPFATMMGVLSCAACARVLFRQSRVAAAA